MIGEHMTEWLGLPVEHYNEKVSETPISAERFRTTIFHFRIEPYDSDLTFAELFSRFLENAGVEDVTALIIGCWGEVGAGDGSEEVVRLLVGARNQLPNLKAIFLGDLVCEESEVSWINQTDVSPLFMAYPNLEHFGIRGTAGLSLGERPRLLNLQSLSIQTGGMPLAIYRQATGGDFPALRKLDLWLGTDGYGGEVRAEHLTELLSGKLFSELKHLGLCDSDVQDDVAVAVASSELVKRLTSLDLSMGTISDRGGEALLASSAVRALESVDLHHHYFSRPVMERLQSALKSVNLLEAEGGDTPEDDRYVAVGE